MMTETWEITNPWFLTGDCIAFGMNQDGDEWVAQIGWADFETATVRASSRDRLLELVRHYVRAR